MIGQAVGPAFKDYAPQIINVLLQKSKQSGSNALSTRQVTICGAFAEIVGGLGPSGCAAFAKELMMYAVSLLSSTHALARRNAAFLLGNLVALGGSQLQGDSQTLFQLLQALEPLFGEAAEIDAAAAEANQEGRQLSFEITDSQAVVDNACGAIARILLHASSGAVPAEQVFPMLLSMLPLRFDMSENYAVCACMRMCVQSSDAKIQAQVRSHIRELVSAMARTLVAIDDEDSSSQFLAKQEVTQIFQTLVEQNKDQVLSLVASLPEEQAAAVQAL